MTILPPATYSSPSSPPPPPPPARGRLRKLAKRVLFGFLGLVIIVLVIFLLLPQWISNDQGRAYILQQLNKHMTTRLTIDRWSLGWFQGTTLSNVRLALPDNTPLFTCPAIHSELTLWGILWGNYDIGATTADGLHLNLTRYADRSTSLDALLTQPDGKRNRLGDALLTLRGSLQAKSAAVTLVSEATHETLAYTNVNVAIAIGSTDAPFHVQLSAVGSDRTFALNATLPALRFWGRGGRGGGQPAAAVVAASDFEINATNLPTALLCDFADLDPRWQDSLGPTLAAGTLSNHADPALGAGQLSMELRGSNGGFVDALLLLHPPTATSPARLSLPDEETYHAFASLNVSAPLAAALARIDPLFGELAGGDGPLNFTVTSLALAPAAPADAQAAGRITFPPLTFHNESLTAQLLAQANGGATAGGKSAAVTVSAEPLRVRFVDRHFICDPCTLTFNHRQKITLRGAVSLTGAVDFLATLSPADDSLGTATEDLPITGTVAAPVVTIPR